MAWHRRRWLATGLVLVALSSEAGSSTPKLASEYEVKAAYVVRFTRYVEWPADVFEDVDSAIVIGVLGKNPFGDLLGKAAKNARSKERPIEVRHLSSVEQAVDCHVVFIGQGQERELAEWIESLRERPVVTITESPEDLGRGAVLSVYLDSLGDGSRVVFGASLPSAEAAGIQLSAAMLPSAHLLVRSKPGEGRRP